VEDADWELIVGLKTTPGNVPDGAVFPELIGPRPREATGDKGYDSIANHAHLQALGVASGIIRRRRRPGGPATPGGSAPRWSASLPKEINAMASKGRGWGLLKVSIPSFLVAIVVNLKRLVKLAFLAAPEPRLATQFCLRSGFPDPYFNP
jgi:IS5 family transposase